MLRNIAIAVSCAMLAGCSSTIAELAKDPATVSVHETFTGFGVNETIDYVRNNSDRSASSGVNGVSAGSATAGVGATAAPPSAAVSPKP
jgi:hypothetical protein